MEYKYYFGVYDSNFTIKMPHSEDTAGVTDPITASTTVKLAPWELKHVKEISETISTSNSTIGIPNKPADCVQIIDTAGAVRTFSISGVRYDAEEEISNLDFMLTQFNMGTRNIEEYIPFVGTKSTGKEKVCYIGIEWLTSIMQSITKGYVFRKVATTNDPNERIPIEPLGDGSGDYGEEFNVGITGFSFSFDPEDPGIMNYTLNLTQRNIYNGAIVYKEYFSGLEESKG